jgi:hypothetical protein
MWCAIERADRAASASIIDITRGCSLDRSTIWTRGDN